jgi:LysM repeat protein
MEDAMRAQVGLFLALALGAAACGGASATPTPTPTAPPSTLPSPSAVPTPEPTAAPVDTPVVTAAPSPTTYVVVKGDNLTRIALRFHVTLQALKDANPQITDANVIKIGQILVIPTP